MATKRGTVSFTITMKIGLVVLLFFIQLSPAFSQAKTYQGIVFDGYTKERIARVDVINSTTKGSIYNNLKAEFKIPAQKGDVLVFTKEGYFNDTIKVKEQTDLIVYLKRTAIPLKPVYITGKFINPEKQLEINKELYSKAYGSISNHDLLSVGGGPEGTGVGLSIDGLYNMLSREGRNATRLRETIDRDYHENVIDARFNSTLVRAATGLEEPQLSDFMMKYRPGYYFVIEANDYDFIKYIRNNYRRYKRNPGAYSLPPLFPDQAK